MAVKHRTRQLNISGGIYGGRLLSVNQTHLVAFMVAESYPSIKHIWQHLWWQSAICQSNTSGDIYGGRVLSVNQNTDIISGK